MLPVINAFKAAHQLADITVVADAGMISEANQVALQAAGLDGRAYEFNHAVWLAVSTPDAEARWLRGEEIFGSVQSANPAAPAQQALIRALQAEALG